jgi:hypothetical protein
MFVALVLFAALGNPGLGSVVATVHSPGRVGCPAGCAACRAGRAGSGADTS